ncbi:MAG: DsbA family protein [Patescibacteria group bacterium]
MTTSPILQDSNIVQSSLPPKPGLWTGASPQLAFITGLMAGVAIISLIGFALAIWYSSSGRLALNSAAAPTVTQGGDSSSPTTVPNQPSSPPSKVNVPVKADDHILGDNNAPITLVEYSDLECPFCKRFHPVMQQIMKEYPGQVRWVYRHFPLSFHANAQKEAEATECAGKLGGNDKFWAYTDKIFERTASNGTGFALDALVPLAQELGLPEAKFKTCLDSGEFTAHVQTDLQEGTSFGVNGTPTTFVNGQPVAGAVPYAQLKAVIDSLLK